MTDLARLIEKLEAASEGSRELDEEIHVGIFSDDATGTYHAKRTYTTSLDAALSLVPDGCYIKNLSQFGAYAMDGLPRWNCDIQLIRKSIYDKSDKPNMRSGTMRMTGALALCIAALKARAALY